MDLKKISAGDTGLTARTSINDTIDEVIVVSNKVETIETSIETLETEYADIVAMTEAEITAILV